jgi:outer membrane immunogenic protein
MKKILVAGIAAAAFCCAPAIAADMPVKAPPMVTPMFNWSGFYVGLEAGYGWGKSAVCEAFCVPAHNVDGFVGGGTLGYNWQPIGNPWVFGIETDWSYAHVKGMHASVPGFNCVGGCESDVSRFGTARGRIGVAFGQFLPYVTGGVAYGKVHGALLNAGDGNAEKSTGVFGGGIEYAFAPNWSAKVEYLYFDKFDRFNLNVCAGPCFVNNISLSVVRFGVNVRFATR